MHGYPEARRFSHDRAFIHTAWKVERQMQSGGDATDRIRGEMRLKRGREERAPATIDQSSPSQVSVEMPALDKFGERELVDTGRPSIGIQLRLAQPRDQRRRGQHPANTQRGGQRL